MFVRFVILWGAVVGITVMVNKPDRELPTSQAVATSRPKSLPAAQAVRPPAVGVGEGHTEVATLPVSVVPR
jgi:hypothetical protein